MSAVAVARRRCGDQVPTGIYLDMIANPPLVGPTKVMRSVMPVRGDHDGIATVDDLLDVYRQRTARCSATTAICSGM